jgi:hypothetical protein
MQLRAGSAGSKLACGSAKGSSVPAVVRPSQRVQRSALNAVPAERQFDSKAFAKEVVRFSPTEENTEVGS